MTKRTSCSFCSTRGTILLSLAGVFCRFRAANLCETCSFFHRITLRGTLGGLCRRKGPANPSEVGVSKMSGMLAAELSKPSKQKVPLLPITTSAFCLFMCFFASHESRLTVSTRTLVEVHYGARSFSEQCGVQTTIPPSQRVPPNFDAQRVVPTVWLKF